MRVNIRAVTPSTMHMVEPEAATDMFWQTDKITAVVLDSESREERNLREVDEKFDKQIWIQNTHLKWGICGYTAFVDNGDSGSNPVPAATVFFAPIKYLPGAHKLPTGPVSADAILLTTVHVSDAYMGLYLEHQLIDTVITEATRRGVKAIEAFARAEDFDDSIVERAISLETDSANRTHDKGRLDLAEPSGEAHQTSMRDMNCEVNLPYSNRKKEDNADEAVGESAKSDAVGGVRYRRGAQGLTPLQELRFIPEAYRGWDHDPRSRRVRDSVKITENDKQAEAEGSSADFSANLRMEGSTDSGVEVVASEAAETTGDTEATGGAEAVGDNEATKQGALPQKTPDGTESYGSEHDSLEWAPMLSEDILEEEGFRVVSHHSKYPRYRRELPDATNLFGKFEKVEHQKLNGPEHVQTVLGGDGGYRNPQRLNSRSETQNNQR